MTLQPYKLAMVSCVGFDGVSISNVSKPADTDGQQPRQSPWDHLCELVVGPIDLAEVEGRHNSRSDSLGMPSSSCMCLSMCVCIQVGSGCFHRGLHDSVSYETNLKSQTQQSSFACPFICKLL